MHRSGILILITCILFSCSEPGNIPELYQSPKDSALKKHFTEITLLPGYDTSNYDFKLLKAIHTHDTGYFKEYLIGTRQNLESKKRELFADSCIHQPALDDLNTDEAYRFIYDMAFCEYKLNITISKTNDTISLRFIIYKSGLIMPDEVSPCSVINEYTKKLNLQQWGKFRDIMQYADYWGLKTTNNRDGVDGSTLQVYGCIKGNPLKNSIQTAHHYIHRWGAESSAIGDAFMLLLKLSGNNHGCMVVR